MDEIDKVRRQIENDDPELVELVIGPLSSVFVSYGGDWGRLGTRIGSNTQLKKLTFMYDWRHVVAGDDLMNLFRGVACNQSIQKLCFRCCDLPGGEIFRSLLPLFKRNQVECLEMLHPLTTNFRQMMTISSECVRSLATALSEFDSLKEVSLFFKCPSAGGNGMEELILALAGHSGVRKLELIFTFLGRNACAALTTLLKNSKLSSLELHDNGINDEGAGALAPGLVDNISLKDLAISHNNRITEVGWRAIFTSLRSSSLEKLSLGNNDGINDVAAIYLFNNLANSSTLTSLNMGCCMSITVTGWWAMLEFLRSQNSLANSRSVKSLNICGRRGITTAGWQAFSTVFQITDSALEKLDLGDNMINDAGMNFIANALLNNTKLRELSLYGNGQVTAAGWQTFSSVIESEYSALEKIDLGVTAISDNTLISFANSLATNTKLKVLLFPLSPLSNIRRDALANGWGAFSRVLCNTSSIMETYESNHTLQKISNIEHTVPKEIRSCLQLNQENNKSQAARLKIIKTHFSGGFDVQPFIDMGWNVLPHAIAWMGRDGKSNETTNHLYEFIRSAVPNQMEK